MENGHAAILALEANLSDRPNLIAMDAASSSETTCEPRRFAEDCLSRFEGQSLGIFGECMLAQFCSIAEAS